MPRIAAFSRLSVADVATALELEPHPEGGFYRETYRSPLTVSTCAGPRALSTTILYLLTEASPSRFHRVRWDETWFFHAGANAELILLGPSTVPDDRRDGRCAEREMTDRGPRRHILGSAFPQMVVPASQWLAARVMSEECSAKAPAWTRVSCVVTPGFEFDGFELANSRKLLQGFPEASELVHELT